MKNQSTNPEGHEDPKQRKRNKTKWANIRMRQQIVDDAIDLVKHLGAPQFAPTSNAIIEAIVSEYIVLAKQPPNKRTIPRMVQLIDRAAQAHQDSESGDANTWWA